MQMPTLLLPHILRLAPAQSVSSEYEELRKFIDGALESTIGHKIDNEKLDALLKQSKNILLDSCAGSGKTEALLYKLFHLTKKENIKPSDIIVLSFNRNVAQMIKDRAKEQFGIEGFSGSLTFHSLAHRIVNSQKRILYDKKNGPRPLFLFVHRIVRQYLNEIGFQHSQWQLARLTKLAMQFISRARKAQMPIHELKRRLQTVVNQKAEALTKIGVVLLLKYEHEMTNRHLLDFDELLIEAVQHIHESRGSCFIRGFGRINDLKFLLIDEMQDLNPLFFSLIQTMRRYNPNLKIFAVGDARQSIYSFAGSDLHYFRNFQNLFEDSTVCHLTVNRRSREHVVKHANAHYPYSLPMQYVHSKDKGVVEMIDIGKVDRNVVAEQCTEIIKRTSGSVLILTRTNRIFGINIERFQELVISALSCDSTMGVKDVRVSTTHSAKGGEADIVIILKSRNSFPLRHPDNVLFEAFGVTDNEVLAEESRLWYVTLTRAKRHLFIIK